MFGLFKKNKEQKVVLKTDGIEIGDVVIGHLISAVENYYDYIGSSAFVVTRPSHVEPISGQVKGKTSKSLLIVDKWFTIGDSIGCIEILDIVKEQNT